MNYWDHSAAIANKVLEMVTQHRVEITASLSKCGRPFGDVLRLLPGGALGDNMTEWGVVPEESGGAQAQDYQVREGG